MRKRSRPCILRRKNYRILRKNPEISNQNLVNPSVPVTASTGKAATNVNGITLHSAFNLPIKSGLKSCGYQK